MPGTVVALDEKVGYADGGIEFSQRSEIRYVATSDGKPRILRSHWSSNGFGARAIGDRVAVRYLRDAPDDAREDSLFSDWFLSLMLLGFGGLGLSGRLHGQSSGTEFTIWRNRRE